MPKPMSAREAKAHAEATAAYEKEKIAYRDYEVARQDYEVMRWWERTLKVRRELDRLRSVYAGELFGAILLTKRWARIHDEEGHTPHA